MQGLLDFGQDGQLGRLFDLVDLVGEDDDIFTVFEQSIEHFKIRVGWTDKGISDEHDFLLLNGGIEEIAIDDFFDSCTFNFGNFGIAIAWEVDQIEFIVDQKYIDRPIKATCGNGSKSKTSSPCVTPLMNCVDVTFMTAYYQKTAYKAITGLFRLCILCRNDSASQTERIECVFAFQIVIDRRKKHRLAGRKCLSDSRQGFF